jgi:3-methyladenine DNA glycosylase AlkD
MNYNEIIRFLKSHFSEKAKKGQEHYGISTVKNYCTPMPAIRKLAKKLGKDHELALRLWDSGIHDARILASLIEEPAQVTSSQMEKWVSGFDSWDVCDQTISNLFSRTGLAFVKAMKWVRSKKEYVKRAGYVMMAALAVHDKKASDKAFVPFFTWIVNGSTDERNFVKKAVNWALRQIGKRDEVLYRLAVRTADEIAKIDSAAAKWVASNALAEFRDLPSTVKRRVGLYGI